MHDPGSVALPLLQRGTAAWRGSAGSTDITLVLFLPPALLLFTLFVVVPIGARAQARRSAPSALVGVVARKP